MITKTFENKEDWFEARKGNIGGSRLKDIVVKRGTGEKIAFYEIIAERIAEAADDENPMERGTRLEEEAIQRFTEVIGKEFDRSLVMWVRDDVPSIYVSPDAFCGSTEAFESKSLSSAKHIEAYLTQTIPDEYEYQKIQYFIVNDELKTLYFGFYDPRMPKHLQFFYITINREDIQEDIDYYLAYQKEKIAKIEEIINQLTF